MRFNGRWGEGVFWYLAEEEEVKGRNGWGRILVLFIGDGIVENRRLSKKREREREKERERRRRRRYSPEDSKICQQLKIQAVKS